jgi:RNA polymerase sigma-70 factor (ECF subfamily)
VPDAPDAPDAFERFFADAEPRLRRALVARLGIERGREATAEALAWAYEHWSEVQHMTNAVGYLYRVGQSRTRPRKAVTADRLGATSVPGPQPASVDPQLWAALWELSDNQRQAVVLVHAYGWTLREAAEVMGCSISTVNTHLRRGLKRLRNGLAIEVAVGGPDDR